MSDDLALPEMADPTAPRPGHVALFAVYGFQSAEEQRLRKDAMSYFALDEFLPGIEYPIVETYWVEVPRYSDIHDAAMNNAIADVRAEERWDDGKE